MFSTGGEFWIKAHTEHNSRLTQIAESMVNADAQRGGFGEPGTDSPHRDRLVRAARRHASAILTFGGGDADVISARYEWSFWEMSWRMERWPESTRASPTTLSGRHAGSIRCRIARRWYAGSASRLARDSALRRGAKVVG